MGDNRPARNGRFIFDGIQPRSVIGVVVPLPNQRTTHDSRSVQRVALASSVESLFQFGGIHLRGRHNLHESHHRMIGMIIQQQVLFERRQIERKKGARSADLLPLGETRAESTLVDTMFRSSGSAMQGLATVDDQYLTLHQIAQRTCRYRMALATSQPTIRDH